MYTRAPSRALPELARPRANGWRATLATVLLLGACTPGGGSGGDQQAQIAVDDAERNEAQAIAGIERDVRLQMMEKRVAELEQEIAAMKGSPVNLDLDLLNRRLIAVEATVPAADAEPEPARPAPVTKPAAPAATSAPKSAKRATPAATKAPPAAAPKAASPRTQPAAEENPRK